MVKNMSRILIALGGNALGEGPIEQQSILKDAVKPIADLIEKGHEVIISHGNGPQVGMISNALERVGMPFPECIAMSQGYIGYHLQNALREELEKRKIEKGVISLITQVVVDEKDKAFQNPSKPIGSFYSLEESKVLEKEKGYIMMEDSGRGYRRVVASPLPIDIVEKESVNDLLANGQVVITVGGGGIPVVRDGYGYRGVDGVIDKDFASGKLGELINADYIFILTAVDRIAINFGQKNQTNLESMSTQEAYNYINEGHFAPGSMLPKVEAGIKFAESGKGRKAIIASLEKTNEALVGKSGTVIYKS